MASPFGVSAIGVPSTKPDDGAAMVDEPATDVPTFGAPRDATDAADTGGATEASDPAPLSPPLQALVAQITALRLSVAALAENAQASPALRALVDAQIDSLTIQVHAMAHSAAAVMSQFRPARERGASSGMPEFFGRRAAPSAETATHEGHRPSPLDRL
jgi:outer membrane murein-binding lipoprotein Lpp